MFDVVDELQQEGVLREVGLVELLAVALQGDPGIDGFGDILTHVLVLAARIAHNSNISFHNDLITTPATAPPDRLPATGYLWGILIGIERKADESVSR